MSGRISRLLLVACVVTSSARAANDPFVGKWKVNPSTSTFTDEMKVEAVGANKYTFSFGPGQVDTIAADGTDQPAFDGTTLSVTVEGPDKWTVVRKMKGRTLLTAHWTLSEDGKTLHDAFTQYSPDGTTLYLPSVYERTGGTSGFAGTWENESAKVPAGIELQIQPYEGDGLSFKRSDQETARRITFDGTDHPDLDSNGRTTSTASSGRRVNEHSLDITEKSKGEVTGTRHIEVSADLNTLTVTLRLVGQSRPQSILVYDREM
jgi:hypothetical protein